jgi:hypothetical protein
MRWSDGGFIRSFRTAPNTDACTRAQERSAESSGMDIRSSGDPGLDEPAVKIAKSGFGYYRPATTLGGKPVSGCAQLEIKFEME